MDTTRSLFGWDGTVDVTGVAAVLTLLGGIVLALVRYVKAQMTRGDRQRLTTSEALRSFPPEAIRDAPKWYVEHDTTSIDPSGREHHRANLGTQEPLFRLLDRTLDEARDKVFLLLLADSGMGKTTALVNYTLHAVKTFPERRFKLLSLRAEGVEGEIDAVEEKPRTFLFLDALDEDPRAIADHRARVAALMELAAPFGGVLVSCRSQFFRTAEEVTKETGIARVHYRGLGDTGEYVFQKFYLCPFSDRQVKRYLTKRFPFPAWRKRKDAQRVVDRLHDLSARPMLLTYVDDLVRSGRSIDTVSDAYREIVAQWIQREKPFVDDGAALLEFSKRLAVDLYVRRELRGGEHAPALEIAELARAWGIELAEWQLTGRSLLTRDSADAYRFAHRTIMEYLFVQSALEGNTACASPGWTDQMLAFLDETIPIDVQAVKAATALVSASKAPNPGLSVCVARAALILLLTRLAGDDSRSRYTAEEFSRFGNSLSDGLKDLQLEPVVAALITSMTGIRPRITVVATLHTPNSFRFSYRYSVAGTHKKRDLTAPEEEALKKIIVGPDVASTATYFSRASGNSETATTVYHRKLGGSGFGVMILLTGRFGIDARADWSAAVDFLDVGRVSRWT